MDPIMQFLPMKQKEGSIRWIRNGENYMSRTIYRRHSVFGHLLKIFFGEDMLKNLETRTVGISLPFCVKLKIVSEEVSGICGGLALGRGSAPQPERASPVASDG